VNGRTLAIDGAFSSQFIFSLDDVSFIGIIQICVYARLLMIVVISDLL